MRWWWSLALTSAFILSAPSAYSTTWYVDPAGSGDFVLIQDAINASATRDTILLAPGVHENDGAEVEVNGPDRVASLVIMGTGSSPQETIIRGSRLQLAATTPEMQVRNLTMEDAGISVGGSASIRECVIRGALSESAIASSGNLGLMDCLIQAGAGPVIALGGNVEMRRCIIELETVGNLIEGSGHLVLTDCSLLGPGSLGGIDWSGTIEMTSCVIDGPKRGLRQPSGVIQSSVFRNCAWLAIEARPGTQIRNCLFEGNGPGEGGGLIWVESETEIAGCTFVGNSADDTNDLGRAVIHVGAVTTDIAIRNCIFAFNDAVDFRTFTRDIDVTCNLFWQNADLSHLGIFELDPSNIVADPLFCDFENGDYTLRADSPAAPLNSYPGCGLIGAFGVGCGEPSSVPAVTAGPVSLRAYPNPFNPVTRLVLAFDPVAGPIDLRVLDVSGRTVRRLAGEWAPVAAPVYWDGRDDVGQPAGSGVYFAKLKTGGQVAVTKIVVSR